jgi:hypothetical protein
MSVQKDKPVIGILGWDPGENVTLAQLEQIPGNIAHPETFDFPVEYRRVKGACYQTVVVEPDDQVLENMIAMCQKMEKDGISAIMGNCGFDALFQQELADAVNVPLFSSSLLQVPMVHQMLKWDQKVGVLTADKDHLTKKHFESVGIMDERVICVEGIENTGEFSKIRHDIHAFLDTDKFRREVLQVTNQLITDHPEIGAIVLECTDLPPFAAEIRKTSGLPVFDIVTLAHFVYESIAGNRWK